MRGHSWSTVINDDFHHEDYTPIDFNQRVIPQRPELSLYHLVSPVFRVTKSGDVRGLLGSCFKVSQIGNDVVYLAAAHLLEVFAEAKAALTESDPNRRVLDAFVPHIAVGVFPPIGTSQVGLPLVLAHPWKMELSTENDLMILIVSHPESPRGVMGIHLNPSTGLDVSALGYWGEHNPLVAAEDGSQFEHHQETCLFESTGQLTDVHPNGRDAGTAWFPCFETNVPVESGMSGGPVCHKPSVSAVGIISRGMTGHRYSLAQTFEHIMDHPFGVLDITARKEGGEISGRLEAPTLRQLGKLGLLRTHREPVE